MFDRAVARATSDLSHAAIATSGGLDSSARFHLASLVQTRQWRLFARELRATARESGRGLLWTLGNDVIKPLAPSSADALIHRLRGRAPDDLGRFSALNPDYLAEHRLSESWREMGLDQWFAQGCRDVMQWRAFAIFDKAQPSRDHVAMHENAYGLEMRDPHADRELIEFCLAVPEWIYRANGVPRAFARKVFSDRLPPEILRERRRGMQGGAWFRRLNREQVARDIERIEASATARRLIDIGRLKQLYETWPQNEQDAEHRLSHYRLALTRGLHIGRFIRWVEGGNA